MDAIIELRATNDIESLGETLTQIAGEKAAIMKAGSPCVSAVQQLDAVKVIAAAATRWQPLP